MAAVVEQLVAALTAAKAANATRVAELTAKTRHSKLSEAEEQYLDHGANLVDEERLLDILQAAEDPLRAYENLDAADRACLEAALN
jgi:hypothetical protein